MHTLARREFVKRSLALLAAGLGEASLRNQRALAQNQPTAALEAAAGELVTPAAEAAIQKALAFLAGRQNEDGAFGVGGYSHNVAVVSLAGMAFMAAGNTPGRGVYGERVARCLDYVLAAQDPSGFITVPEAAQHGPMYGHGFATLFLAEVYGMSPLSEVREKLAAAVKLIIETQNAEGGWRYQPQRAEADLSVTICQVMALRAARNAGVYVPPETIERCIDYVKRSQNADGGFTYMLSQGGPSAFPRTAAGVVALYSAGIYEGNELRKGLEYLSRHPPRKEGYSHDHYFYGQYYAVQAMWQAGGNYWQTWYPAIRDVLVAQQRKDGAWSDDLIGTEYATSMAALILQMPNNYLPIFQR